ncbi:MAG: P-type conjugative transfer protein TrbJ [Rhodospirillaceae bacterium]|nr:P-type conjugative transfer protein TrbJ [Rhodospirillaceae bacterium]
MKRRTLIASSISAVACAGAAVWFLAPADAIPVFDSANYAENMLQAARSLQQINNQIQSLQNQAVMVQNMARNLQKLEYSSANQILGALQRIDGLMGQAQGITYNVANTESSFQKLYPRQYDSAITQDDLVVDARTRWQASMDGYRQTMTVQSQVVENVQADRALLDELVTVSQGAQGQLQAQQATNQLLALSAKQQLQIQNMMAAQFRAEAMEKARKAQSEEQGRAAFDKFMGDGKAYTPRTP